jgi:hypothetical protein
MARKPVFILLVPICDSHPQEEILKRLMEAAQLQQMKELEANFERNGRFPTQ